MDIKEKLEKIFQNIFEDENIKINENTTPNDIKDWDSLTHILLLLEIEKEFNIKFTTEEIKDIKTVGDIMSLIQKQDKRG